MRLACVGEREAGEQVVGDRARVLQVTQLGDQHEVLPAGEHLVDRGELAGQADRLAHVAGVRGDVEAVHGGGARVGLQQRRQDPHQRGLAGAVRAEQREDAARLDVEVDAAQHVQVLERLLDALDPDRGFEGLVVVIFCSFSLRVFDRLGQAGALLVDPLLAGVGLREGLGELDRVVADDLAHRRAVGRGALPEVGEVAEHRDRGCRRR